MIKKLTLCCFTVFLTNLWGQTNQRSELTLDTTMVNQKMEAYSSTFHSFPQTAKNILDTCLYISQKLNYIKGIGNVYKEYGWYYISTSEYDKADKYLKLAHQIFTEIKASNDLARTKVNLGILHAEQAQYPTAITHFADAQKIYFQIRDTLNIAKTDNNIGKLYSITGDTGQALFYFKRALINNLLKKNTLGILSNYSGIGTLFNAKKDGKNAINVGQHMMKLASDSGFKYHEGVANHIIGTGFHYLELPDSSLKYWKKALKIQNEIGSRNDVAMIQLNIANEIRKQNLSESITLTESSLNISQLTQNKNTLLQCYQLMKELKEEEHQYKSALKFANLYETLKDSLNGEGMKRSIIQAERKVETEKNEAEKKNLLQINEINELKIKNNKYVMTGILIIGLSALLALVLLLLNIKNTAKIKNLQIKQKLLVSQLNPHFIFNSLNSILNHIYKNQSLVAAKSLHEFSDLMRMILVFSRKEYITLEEEIHFLETYLALQKMRFSEKLEWDIYVDKLIDLEEVIIPTMLIQPFIENSIEHGLFKNSEVGKIRIAFTKIKSDLCIEIDDNGIGLQHKLQSTKYESLATKIITERISVLKTLFGKNTTFEIINKSETSQNEHGVKIIYHIPYKTKQ